MEYYESSPEAFGEASVAMRLNQIAGDEVYVDQVHVLYHGTSPYEYSEIDSRDLAVAVQLDPGVYEFGMEAIADVWNDDQPVLTELSYVILFDFAPVTVEAPCGGDLDEDGDFDLADMAVMQTCMTGPLQ